VNPDRKTLSLALGVVITSLAGVAVSVYLLSFKLSDKPRVCLTGSGCADVNASSYSYFLGIPVSVFGIVAYLALVAVGAAWAAKRDKLPEWLLLGAFGVAVGGFLFSLYLTYLEAYVIYAWCSWCLTSAALITIDLVLLMIGLRQRS